MRVLIDSCLPVKAFVKVAMLAGLTIFGTVTPTLAQSSAPALSFSGYVDADFATSFAGGGLKDPSHTTGLEVDLTTTITFNPKLNAVLYTTMNDGAIPAQGAGNTWAPVNFDGATLNWQYDDKTLVYVGDIIQGTGYFNYYFHKRTAMVVGEHAVRGVGFSRDGWTVATGVAGMGAKDSTGAPIPTSQWSTFAKYDYAIDERMTLTPSAKYTAGVPGATPFVGGLSFDGAFGAVSLSADAAVNYYSTTTDPGLTFLLEPLYTHDKYTIAGAFYYNKWTTAPNRPVQTVTGAELDNIFVYVEPGYSYNDTYAFGLPIEYHNAHLANAVASGIDESIWLVPTVYIYPGSGVQWWIWAQVLKPLTGLAGTDLRYFAGSEIIFKF